jgi:Flp pilus assembly secretin CpaC
MKSRLFSTIMALLVVVATTTLVVPVAAQYFENPHRDFDNTRPGTSQTLILEHGRSIILKFNQMRRAAVVHPDVANITVMSANELMVVARPEVPRDQEHTMIYVWDKDGLHNFAVTVVGVQLAEAIARDLRNSLSPNLNVEVVSDSLVVVEGTVQNNEAKENLDTLLEAASTDDVRVVGMVGTAEAVEDAPARRAAEALNEILGPNVKVSSWGSDILVVEGQLPSHEELQQARDAIAAISGGLRVVDTLTVAGEDPAAQAPVAQIQRLLGPDFTVTQLRGNAIAVDGIVSSAEELERVNRLLAGFENVQTINLVQVVPPRPDLATAQAALSGALGDQIQVTTLGDQGLMLEGAVPSEEALAQIDQVLSLFPNVPFVNLVTVVTPDRRQVMVAVKVLEVNAGETGNLGVDWGQYQGTPYVDAQYRPQPFLFGQIPGLDGWRELYHFSTQIHALIDNQKAKILSQPNLLVNEGEEAEILIGGEIPIPIATTGIGGGAAISVEWKPFGVRLNIMPTITPAGDKILMQVAPEVSSLDFGSGVTVSGLSIPALRTRRAETTVTVSDGGVLTVGGLISSDESKTVSKIPILGDLPIIGQFFRHDTTIENKSELIILVMPQILGEDGQPVHPIPVPEGLGTELWGGTTENN